MVFNVYLFVPIIAFVINAIVATYIFAQKKKILSTEHI